MRWSLTETYVQQTYAYPSNSALPPYPLGYLGSTVTGGKRRPSLKFPIAAGAVGVVVEVVAVGQMAACQRHRYFAPPQGLLRSHRLRLVLR